MTLKDYQALIRKSHGGMAPVRGLTMRSHSPNAAGPPYLPMQKVEKMRLRMSSAVVAPVMASSGRKAA